MGVAVSRASSRWIPWATPSSCDNHTCLWTLPRISWVAKSLPSPPRTVTLGENKQIFQTSVVNAIGNFVWGYGVSEVSVPLNGIVSEVRG